NFSTSPSLATSGETAISLPTGEALNCLANGDSVRAATWPRRSWITRQKATSSGTRRSSSSRGGADDTGLTRITATQALTRRRERVIAFIVGRFFEGLLIY